MSDRPRRVDPADRSVILERSLSTGRHGMMQVCCIKARCPFEFSPIPHSQDAAAELDETLAAQPLQSAIHMHRRQPERVGQHDLGERQAAGALVRLPGGAHLERQLAEQVGSALVSRTAPGVDDPLARHRCVDQRGLPQEVTQAWELPDPAQDGRVWDGDDLRRGERATL